MDEKSKRLRITSEERAEWDAARRQLQERIDAYDEWKREREARDERRRERLRRFSFGLLGRA
jgi:anti-sigma factor RsiW